MRRSGTTLVELMLACTVFSVIVVTVFGVLRYGTRHWRSIEDRNAIQVEIRKAEFDIIREVTRSSLDTVITYPWTGVSDYRHALALKTAMSLDSPEPYFVTNEEGKPQWQRWVLYYIIRPPGDGCAPPGGTDNICPHKWLIRKDIALNGINSASDIPTYLTTTITATEPHVLKAYLLAKDILSFNIAVIYPEVLVDIKCFKKLEYSGIAKIGVDELDTNRATIQVDNRIIPRN